jgi:ATP-dependent DNA ligase
MSPRTTRTLPTIEPIVPVLGSPPPHDLRWLYEPKFDGWRGGRELFEAVQRLDLEGIVAKRKRDPYSGAPAGLTPSQNEGPCRYVARMK